MLGKLCFFNLIALEVIRFFKHFHKGSVKKTRRRKLHEGII